MNAVVYKEGLVAAQCNWREREQRYHVSAVLCITDKETLIKEFSGLGRTNMNEIG